MSHKYIAGGLLLTFFDANGAKIQEQQFRLDYIPKISPGSRVELDAVDGSKTIGEVSDVKHYFPTDANNLTEFLQVKLKNSVKS